MTDQIIDYIIVTCPHCFDNVFIYTNEINCRIFRHGVYKHNNEPVNPHLDQNSCEQLIISGNIYGCCKPFILNSENKAEICGYI